METAAGIVVKTVSDIVSPINTYILPIIFFCVVNTNVDLQHKYLWRISDGKSKKQ